MRAKTTPTLIVAVLAAIAACAEAGGEIKGGEPTQEGTRAMNPEPGTCENTAPTWTALYNDLFGPTGRPGSCAFASRCHGSPDGDGARSGSGIQCFDRQGCRQSLFDKGALEPSDAAAPEESALLRALLRIRRPDGTESGFMPAEPSDYYFPDTCVERITSWIRNGANDD